MAYRVLAVDTNVVVADALLSSNTTLSKIEVITLLCITTGAAAHLAALVASSGAFGNRSRRGALARLTVDQAVVSVMASVGNGGIIGDTSPDG